MEGGIVVAVVAVVSAAATLRFLILASVGSNFGVVAVEIAMVVEIVVVCEHNPDVPGT